MMLVDDERFDGSVDAAPDSTDGTAAGALHCWRIGVFSSVGPLGTPGTIDDLCRPAKGCTFPHLYAIALQTSGKWIQAPEQSRLVCPVDPPNRPALHGSGTDAPRVQAYPKGQTWQPTAEVRLLALEKEPDLQAMATGDPSGHCVEQHKTKSIMHC
eukprot:7391029-Prymnesium_polylepis.1